MGAYFALKFLPEESCDFVALSLLFCRVEERFHAVHMDSTCIAFALTDPYDRVFLGSCVVPAVSTADLFIDLSVKLEIDSFLKILRHFVGPVSNTFFFRFFIRRHVSY